MTYRAYIDDTNDSYSSTTSSSSRPYRYQTLGPDDLSVEEYRQAVRMIKEDIAKVAAIEKEMLGVEDDEKKEIVEEEEPNTDEPLYFDPENLLL